MWKYIRAVSVQLIVQAITSKLSEQILIWHCIAKLLMVWLCTTGRRYASTSYGSIPVTYIHTYLLIPWA
jgi:hypothetical protein